MGGGGYGLDLVSRVVEKLFAFKEFRRMQTVASYPDPMYVCICVCVCVVINFFVLGCRASPLSSSSPVAKWARGGGQCSKPFVNIYIQVRP